MFQLACIRAYDEEAVRVLMRELEQEGEVSLRFMPGSEQAEVSARAGRFAGWVCQTRMGTDRPVYSGRGARPGRVAVPQRLRAERLGGGEVNRDEYLVRCREMARRGTQLEHAKLDEKTVEQIRLLHERKQRLVKALNDKYSAEALARRYRVHVRTVEKLLRRESWGHVR